jgi:allophanate hydrolase
VAVAAGHVSFALGTDTAGSGRVPAALNGVAGMKPTRGLLSARGVAPACRTLDCVSIFALNCADARQVFQIAENYDDGDSFSRRARTQRFPRGALRIGMLAPSQAEFFGDGEAAELYAAALARLAEIDFIPFREAGGLLYEGPWLAERLAAFRDFAGADASVRGNLHPVVGAVLECGARFSAADVFAGYYRLRDLARRTMREWAKADAIALPAAVPIYTVDEVLAEPFETNRRLGLYTNFVNLLDLCALALPAGRRRRGLPFGITLVAPPLHDQWLCSLGVRWEAP